MKLAIHSAYTAGGRKLSNVSFNFWNSTEQGVADVCAVMSQLPRWNSYSILGVCRTSYRDGLAPKRKELEKRFTQSPLTPATGATPPFNRHTMSCMHPFSPLANYQSCVCSPLSRCRQPLMMFNSLARKGRRRASSMATATATAPATVFLLLHFLRFALLSIIFEA